MNSAIFLRIHSSCCFLKEVRSEEGRPVKKHWESSARWWEGELSPLDFWLWSQCPDGLIAHVFLLPQPPSYFLSLIILWQRPVKWFSVRECGLWPHWEMAAKQASVLFGKERVQVPSWVRFRFLKWIVLILSERIGSPVFLLAGGSGSFHRGKWGNASSRFIRHNSHLDSDAWGPSHCLFQLWFLLLSPFPAM